SKINLDLRNNCLSALSIYVADSLVLQNEIPVIIKPYKDSDEAVLVSKKYWGAFELLIVEAQKGIYKKKTAYFIGAIKEEHGSAYICDNNKYLTVKGNTCIKGDIYVPGAFLKREFFTGTISPSDTIRHSNKSLPLINKNVILFANKIRDLKQNRLAQFLIYPGSEIPFNSSVSFLDSTHVYYSSDNIIIANVTLDGNIIIRSDKSITINNSAKLNNIILSAPIINVQNEFKGCVQLLSDSSLIIQRGSNLLYPSFVGVYSSYPSNITIYEKAVVSGGITLYTEFDKSKEESVINIFQGATINGVVYSNNAVKLGGNIYGSLICMRVISFANNTNENDMLYNCIINPTVLKKDFFYPCLFSNSSRSVIFEETKNEITSRNID
ncbi:MAG: hypothetical protein JXB34_13960, partial [Bacteroidales bacterium]|nr:hypothetical protein [Bacteroidales bacterium]